MWVDNTHRNDSIVEKEALLSMDFTLKKYEELCASLKESGYQTLTIRDFLRIKDPDSRFAILRHDVDRGAKSALGIARIENRFGIRGTYYFRVNKRVLVPNIIEEISSMGNEIGYHYEALDKAKGDMNVAIEIFDRELAILRSYCSVNTVCMHGNPLTPWDNKEIWNSHDFAQFGIIGEAYLSLPFERIAYFSDTGGSWNSKYNLKDKPPKRLLSERVNSTDRLVSIIRKKRYSGMCILIHPNRWNGGVGSWIGNRLFDAACNTAKRFITLRRGTQG